MRKFRDVGIRDYEFSTGEEICITHPKGILRIQKFIADGFRKGRILPRFRAKFIRQDDEGISIQLALDLTTRYHVVSEYLSLNDITSVNIGTDGETYIVIAKKRYDSLWKKNSVSFALIDLIGTKPKFRHPLKLMAVFTKIQAAIDNFARIHPEVAVISYSDTVIVKSVWCYHKRKRYSPEHFMKAVLELRAILKRVSKSECYVIITQGQNLIKTEKILHINDVGNHVGMLSLGYPFAALFEIEKVVKILPKADKRELYMEDMFYHSLIDKTDFFDLATMKQLPFDFLRERIGSYIAIDAHKQKRGRQ